MTKKPSYTPGPAEAAENPRDVYKTNLAKYTYKLRLNALAPEMAEVLESVRIYCLNRHHQPCGDRRCVKSQRLLD